MCVFPFFSNVCVFLQKKKHVEILFLIFGFFFFVLFSSILFCVSGIDFLFCFFFFFFEKILGIFLIEFFFLFFSLRFRNGDQYYIVAIPIGITFKSSGNFFRLCFLFGLIFLILLNSDLSNLDLFFSF